MSRGLSSPSARLTWAAALAGTLLAATALLHLVMDSPADDAPAMTQEDLSRLAPDEAGDLALLEELQVQEAA